MSQHDYVLENQSGASFRAGLNSILDAVASQNTGSAPPTATYPSMSWPDTTSGIVKQRDSANTSWLRRFGLNDESVYADFINFIGSYGGLHVGGKEVVRFGGVSGDNSGQLAGFRNLIINGDCRIAQYGPKPVVANNWAYGGCDCIAILAVGTTASGTIQQYPNQPSQSGFAQGAIITTTGSGSFYAQQRIEAANARRLNSKSVIFSCAVLQTTGGTLNVQMSIGRPTTTADTFSAQTNISSSALIPIPSGVWTKLYLPAVLGAADASLGLVAQVAFPSIGAVTAKDFLVGDWQLEGGSIATPFEHRPIGLELALCQRYYQKGTLTACGDGVMAYLSSASNLTTSMRVTPTVTVADNVGTLGKVSADSTNNIAAQAYGMSAGSIRIQVNGVVIPANNIMVGTFTASAEL